MKIGVFGDKSELQKLLESMAEEAQSSESPTLDEVLSDIKGRDSAAGTTVALFFFAYQRALRAKGTYTLVLGYKMAFRLLKALANGFWDLSLDANQHTYWLCQVASQASDLINHALEDEEQTQI